MKVPGSIYRIKRGNTYVAEYTFWPDVYRRAPINMRKISEHVAHVIYGFGGHLRGIDIFLIKDPNYDIDNDVYVKRTIEIAKRKRRKDKKIRRTTVVVYPKGIEQIDKLYNIQAEIKIDHIDILHAVRTDIIGFARRPAKNPGQNRISIVHKIIPKTTLKKIKQKDYLRMGKQEFVPSCALDTNLDFSWGCLSSFVPEKNATFDGKTFTNYFLDLDAGCEYCYASYQHKSFAKFFVDIKKEELIEKLRKEKKDRKNLVLRLGKRTEAGSKLTIDSLVTTLEACLKTKTKIVMPTKYLEFNEEIAKLLKKTRSVVLYSIGWDKFERGACIHGCPNDWRLEQAVQYKKAGVNSVLYLHIDLPHEMAERESKILKFAEKNNIPIQLLAIRITSKKFGKELTGVSWKDLQTKTNHRQLLIDFAGELKNQGGYRWKNNIMIAQEKHDDYLRLIGNNNKYNIRMCHHDDRETYCGKCFLNNKGFIIPTEKPNINYELTFSKAKKRWLKNNKKAKDRSLFKHN